jgi:outer membrane protein, heavy metal efflux system
MALRAAMLLLALAGPPDAPPSASVCTGTLGRDRVVECALAASPAVQAASLGVEALAGRRTAARTVLPSNPSVEVTAAARRSMWSGERDVNVYGRLSQELEIAGQRRKRVAVVDAEIDGQQRRVDAVRREVAAAALHAYYELVASLEEQAMLARIARASQALVELAAAGERTGLASGLTADVAAAAIVRIQRQQVEAERRVVAARSVLAGLLGQDPAAPDLDVPRDISPLPIAGDLNALIESALQQRAELAVAAAEKEAQRRQIELLKRLRAPNPSLVAYAQRDGFNERVLGGGIAIPIPLPSPLGRTYAGEIAEAKARVRQAEAEIERIRRQVRAEVVAAHHNLRAREQELALFDPERLRRAEGHIEALSQEMAAGRLQIREAIVLQQQFLELIDGHIEARQALGLASVELARATGRLAAGGPR